MTEFRLTPPFEKDFKRLLKKYPSLKEDFGKFKLALETEGVNLTGTFRIPLGSGIGIPFYKAKKFRCKSLQAGVQSGIRVIFALERTADCDIISFVEIYHKNSQENNDMERIRAFTQSLRTT